MFEFRFKSIARRWQRVQAGVIPRSNLRRYKTGSCDVQLAV